MGKMRKLLVGALLVAAGTMAMAHSDGGYVDNDFFKGMKKGDKAAVLMVHFGTTYDDARALSIDAINNKAKKEFKGVDVKEAFTSRIVMRRLKERGIEKLNPSEVINQLKADGYTHLLVQGTHIMNGVESTNLAEELKNYEKDFKDIRIGNPLLTDHEDYEAVAKALSDRIGPLKEGQGVVLVGHGTHHFGGSAYAMMDYVLTDAGLNTYAVGTVEGYPAFDNVVKKLKANGVKDVILVPFMFVAGDHANNDIAEDWNKDLQKEGFTVSKVILEGLGQNPAIQNLYIKHAEFASYHKPEDMQAKKVQYSNEKD